MAEKGYPVAVEVVPEQVQVPVPVCEVMDGGPRVESSLPRDTAEAKHPVELHGRAQARQHALRQALADAELRLQEAVQLRGERGEAVEEVTAQARQAAGAVASRHDLEQQLTMAVEAQVACVAGPVGWGSPALRRGRWRRCSSRWTAWWASGTIRSGLGGVR